LRKTKIDKFVTFNDFRNDLFRKHKMALRVTHSGSIKWLTKWLILEVILCFQDRSFRKSFNVSKTVHFGSIFSKTI